MNLLYFLLLGTVFTVVINSPILGLIIAAVAILWLLVIGWQSRNDPIDPSLY